MKEDDTKLKTDKNIIYRDSCPACTSSKFSTLLSLPITDQKISNFLKKFYSGRVPLNQITPLNYVIAKCTHCSLLFQKEILSDENMFLLDRLFLSILDWKVFGENAD